MFRGFLQLEFGEGVRPRILASSIAGGRASHWSGLGRIAHDPLQGDVATIDSIMADDYVRIQPDGSVADKAAVLAAFLPVRRA
jgi:hypothetical protein